MMIQKFIPEVFEGDKRVLLIDGEDCGFAVSRIPQGDDFRGNLAAGGKAEVVELNERDKEIIQSIKPDLEKKGITFNTTSDTEVLIKLFYLYWKWHQGANAIRFHHIFGNWPLCKLIDLEDRI